MTGIVVALMRLAVCHGHTATHLDNEDSAPSVRSLLPELFGSTRASLAWVFLFDVHEEAVSTDHEIADPQIPTPLHAILLDSPCRFKACSVK